MDYFISIVLILLSALFSGLTLGLMGLDVHALERKKKLGNKEARKIYPVRKRGNLLLTTLLLGNVAVNAFLAIYLGSIATGFLAGILSTALIFVFGEIIPQAVISRHAMAFGARTAWLVRGLILLFYPVTAPIAWILDRVLGSEMATIYSKRELVKVIEEHEASSESEIDKDERRILKGSLTFSDKLVSDVMTPDTVAVMLEVNDALTPQLLKTLRSSSHSRFPVYRDNRNSIIGMLYLRELVGRKTQGRTVGDLYDKTVHFVDVNSKLDDVLNAFLKTRRHLFVAVDEFGAFEGLISVEDVLEEIVGKEIMDEYDKHADLRKLAKSKADDTKVITSGE